MGYDPISRTGPISEAVRRQARADALATEARSIREQIDHRKDCVVIGSQFHDEDGIRENGEHIARLEGRLSEIDAELDTLNTNNEATE